MKSQEILQKYLDFYAARGHKLVPNVSLVPENDPTLLFVNSGMFPLVAYLSGETHPLGKRLVNVQRCLRFDDLPDIGDATHTLAFHMIGNWSLGDYFKDEQLPWAYEFLIEQMGIDPQRLVATVFAGDDDAPRDEQSIEILKNVFAKYGINAEINQRIWLYSKDQGNWWKRGDAVGELGGPSSEVFFYLGEGSPEGKSPEDYEDEFVEIGNSVFMEYKKAVSGWERLPQSNVDYGGGFERIALAVQGKTDIFETDNFYPIIQKIEDLTGKKYKSAPEITYAMRNLADHIRGSTFLAMDGVRPSNKDQGYILRRLLRRMVRFGLKLGMEKDISTNLVGVVTDMFAWLYSELPSKRDEITRLFAMEEEKFFKTLRNGSKQVQKILAEGEKTTEEFAQKAFELYQSLGYPSEIFQQDIEDAGYSLDKKLFDQTFTSLFSEHQSGSRSGAEGKFKGGLAEHTEQIIKYHTATHLLQLALREVLGPDTVQLGSNITNERLRFDFPSKNKLTAAQITQIQNRVNELVDQKIPVTYVDLPKEEAILAGALYMKNESYPEVVRVYYIGSDLSSAISREFCGGPHVSNTEQIGHIEFFKQESLGNGVLRVYARNS